MSHLSISSGGNISSIVKGSQCLSLLFEESASRSDRIDAIALSSLTPAIVYELSHFMMSELVHLIKSLKDKKNVHWFVCYALKTFAHSCFYISLFRAVNTKSATTNAQRIRNNSAKLNAKNGCFSLCWMDLPENVRGSFLTHAAPVQQV